METFVKVGKTEEVPEGSATAFAIGGKEVAVARVGGKLFAFDDICSHRKCNLAMGGEIEGTTITCECHGSIFEMSDGSVLEGPATEPIATFEVGEEDGQISVKV
jgi:3-phenylpropionate/trans-cinnamate dioxygenase ferredoxin subunit